MNVTFALTARINQILLQKTSLHSSQGAGESRQRWRARVCVWGADEACKYPQILLIFLPLLILQCVPPQRCYNVGPRLVLKACAAACF